MAKSVKIWEFDKKVMHKYRMRLLKLIFPELYEEHFPTCKICKRKMPG